MKSKTDSVLIVKVENLKIIHLKMDDHSIKSGRDGTGFYFDTTYFTNEELDTGITLLMNYKKILEDKR